MHDEGENSPVPLLVENVTVPVGVVALELVSVTVAVHVAAWETGTELGAHFTDVVVGSFATT